MRAADGAHLADLRRVRIEGAGDPGRPLRRPLRLRPTEGLRPRLGGTLEFSGVFGGTPSLASSSATRCANPSTNSISCSRLNASRSARFIQSLITPEFNRSKENSQQVSSYKPR